MHWLLTIVLTNFIRFALEELTLVMLVSYITFNYFPSSEKTEKQLPGQEILKVKDKIKNNSVWLSGGDPYPYPIE